MASRRGSSGSDRCGTIVRWAAVAAVAAMLLAGCAGPRSGGQHSPAVIHSVGPRPASPWTTSWDSYHATQSRTGAVAGDPKALAPTTIAWHDDLGAAVYGQPVIADGRVIAATERNRVVALNPLTGDVLWSVSIGTPLTPVIATAGCGNVDPLGITSTPAIDTTTGTVFVVGEISDGHGAVHHQLVSIDISTGSVIRSENVDPPLGPGQRAANLLQRAGLAIGNGRVYVSYGGNSGDCGNYHGWVVGVAVSGPPNLVSFEVAADGQGGAIWESGGAPALDADGNLYVTTGNANPDPPQGGPDDKQYTESIVKLAPDLTVLASYKDRIAGGDEDLATGNPVLLGGDLVFVVGKTDVGYILKQSDLSVVARVLRICGSDPDGGPAYDVVTNRLFIPCRGGGVQVVDASAHSAVKRLAGANGAPIVIGNTVWAASWLTGRLYEYSAASGAVLQSIAVGTPLPHFASPSTAFGDVYIGTTKGVTAFSGPRP